MSGMCIAVQSGMHVLDLSSLIALFAGIMPVASRNASNYADRLGLGPVLVVQACDT